MGAFLRAASERIALGTLGASGDDPVALAHDAGARHGVDPALILAVMRTESGFNPAAVNPDDPSFGLMQVMVPTAHMVTGDTSLSAQDLLDPWTNVDIGTRYLRQQLDRYGGDTAAAVSAYNAGTATPANQGYVDRVLGGLATFRAQLGAGLSGSWSPTGQPAVRWPTAFEPSRAVAWVTDHPYLAGAAVLALLWWLRR